LIIKKFLIYKITSHKIKNGKDKMENEIKLTKLAKCAGCGAKVGTGVLSQLIEGLKVHKDDNLLVGFDKSDDASVYQISEELALVQTIDFFPPIADDPYIYGQIAATNALSDIYAMGGEPTCAQNVLIIPEDMPANAVHQILRGGCDKIYEAGALITGGHSIYGEVPIYGLAVTGFVHPSKLIVNSNAKVNDILFLTKPLGVGLLINGKKAGILSAEGETFMNTLMTTLNKKPRDLMVKYNVHACTDVTGFSLLGHAIEMAQGSNVSIELNVNNIDIIPEALEIAHQGKLSKGLLRNKNYASYYTDFQNNIDMEHQYVLFDPQTSGGLLIAVDPAQADAFYQELQDNVPSAQKIGRVIEQQKKAIFVTK